MQKVHLIELVIRFLPESLLFVLGCYSLTKTQMNYKKYFASVTLLTVISYLIKLLPIQPGINTILCLGVLICLNIYINKIKIAKAVQSSILTVAVLFMAEAINVIILKLLNFDLNTVFQNPILKNIYGMPSLILLGLFIMIVRHINSKKE